MSAPLDDIASYSGFVYALTERHPLVTSSTLVLAPIGATLAKLEGRIECQGGVHVEVWELVDFAAKRIRTYSYEVYRGGEKTCWYDSWEHPETPALASTFPHHEKKPPRDSQGGLELKPVQLRRGRGRGPWRISWRRWFFWRRRPSRFFPLLRGRPGRQPTGRQARGRANN